LAIIHKASHMSGSWPVLSACIGVNCATAGGFFRLLLSFFCLASAAHRTGSTSAGHQFFGGSLKNSAHAPMTSSMYSATRFNTTPKFEG
jgi:hypothetical protein